MYRLEIRCENLCKEWKQWRQVWDAYEDVTELRNKTSRRRVAPFITCIGKEAVEVHNGLPFQSDEEKADINKVLELWANHCIASLADRINQHLHHYTQSARRNLRVWNLER